MAAVCIVSWTDGCSLWLDSTKMLLPADLLFAAGRSAKTFGLASHCRLLLPVFSPFALHDVLLEVAPLASSPVARNSFVT